MCIEKFRFVCTYVDVDKLNRYLSVIFVLIFFASCLNSKESQKDSNVGLTIEQDTFDIHGLWVMPAYVDSILVHKTISKYRIQRPTQFAILIDIDKDSLKTYGSILDLEKKYSLTNDTICVFDKRAVGEWTLTLNRIASRLELRNTNSHYSAMDSVVYVFEKRPELRCFLDTFNRRPKTRTSFVNLFNEKLFAGTYEIVWPEGQRGEVVTFKPDGAVNLKSFDIYEVGVYFGTCHPFKNEDVITFGKVEGEAISRKSYNWVYSGDTLILTSFVPETIIFKGKEVITDDWILGDELIKLVKRH